MALAESFLGAFQAAGNRRTDSARTALMFDQHDLAVQQAADQKLMNQRTLQMQEEAAAREKAAFDENLRNRREYIERPPDLAFSERSPNIHYSMAGALQVPGSPGSQTNRPPIGEGTGLMLTAEQYLNDENNRLAQKNYQTQVETDRIRDGRDHDLALANQRRDDATSGASIRASDTSARLNNLQIDEHNLQKQLQAESDARVRGLRGALVDENAPRFTLDSATGGGVGVTPYAAILEGNKRKTGTFLRGLGETIDYVDLNKNNRKDKGEEITEADLRNPQFVSLLQARMNKMGLGDVTKYNQENERNTPHQYFDFETRKQNASIIEGLNHFMGVDASSLTDDEAVKSLTGAWTKMRMASLSQTTTEEQ